MRGGGKLGKPTHLRRNLRRMMGISATFFFARYEGVPRGHLNQHYERTDQVFSALPSRPTGDMSVDFLGMSAKGRVCGLQRGALICITCPRLQRQLRTSILEYVLQNTFAL